MQGYGGRLQRAEAVDDDGEPRLLLVAFGGMSTSIRQGH